MPPAVAAPPPTQVEPVTETLHGVEITDPYRWLEDQNSPRTRAWIDEQTTYTRAYFDAIVDRPRIRRRVKELLDVETITEPWKVGDRYFYLKRSPELEQPVIMMRGQGSSEVVLVDPSRNGGGSTTAVNIVKISSDGRILAYGIRNNGAYPQEIEFFDVHTMQVLADRLPHGVCYGLVLSQNGRGFYYSHEVARSVCSGSRAVYWHEFGSSSDSDREVFSAGNDPGVHLGLFAAPGERLLGYLVIREMGSLAFDLFIHDLSGAAPPTKLLEDLRPLFWPFFANNKLLALTDWKAPNLRIVAIDLNDPEREKWTDVIPESRHRISDFAFIGHTFCVVYVDNVSSRIELFDGEGHWKQSVPCPGQGTAQLLWRFLEEDHLFYRFSSFVQPPTIFSLDLATRQQRVWANTSTIFDPSSFEVTQVRFKSTDGVEIPMFLVAQKGKRSPGPRPTFLTAYGGFGSSRTPQFNVYSTFLIEHGFLFALAIIRGGGEFGEEWHRAATRSKRQTAFEDFIGAAEWLISNRYAVRGRIAIGGGSNAGLLTGVALTRRPDLFRAAIMVGPLLDMLRYHKFDSAQLFVDEYGTADTESDLFYLRDYSPYHNVKDGAEYPAVMLVSGDSDTCCNPMHARKMAARLQVATSASNPILLDYKSSWGHAPVQPLTSRIEALTDRLAFICHELEVRL